MVFRLARRRTQKNSVADIRELSIETEFVGSDVRYKEDVRSLLDKARTGSVAWT